MLINQIIEQNRSLVLHLVCSILANTFFNQIDLDPIKNELKGTNSVDHDSNSTFILLDPQTISEQTRLTCSIYEQKYGLFDHQPYRVLSPIISLTIDKPNVMHTVKMNFRLADHHRPNNSNLICAYWKIFANLTAQWSTDGCVRVNMTNTSVTCRCNHLTHFAVLMVGD